MSKERQRARAARQAARAVEVEAAARARAKAERRARRVPSVAVPRRRRRYGALPARTAAALGAGWFAVQALLWQFFDPLATRFSLAVLTGASLLVLIKTRRSTPR